MTLPLPSVSWVRIPRNPQTSYTSSYGPQASSTSGQTLKHGMHAYYPSPEWVSTLHIIALGYQARQFTAETGLRVFMADVYIDVLKTDIDRPVEYHRFLVHKADGKPLTTRSEKKYGSS